MKVLRVQIRLKWDMHCASLICFWFWADNTGKSPVLGPVRWDGAFEAEGGGGHNQGPLPSSPQLSSSHLDTMWEQGTEARGIAEGRVRVCWGILYRTSRASGKRWWWCCCWWWYIRGGGVVCVVVVWWGGGGTKKLPVFGLFFPV